MDCADFDEGLATPLLEQLVQDLRAALPAVLGQLPLSQAWAYKYDTASAPDGIGIHADAAAVNLNLWLTDDSANLESDDEDDDGAAQAEGVGSGRQRRRGGGGGLVVWRKEPPSEQWDFEGFNSADAATQAALLAFVQQHDDGGGGSSGGSNGEGKEDEDGGGGARPVHVPYQCNRMTLFKSTLLHRTEPGANFRKGHRNRRVNLTLLFGGP